MVECVVAIPTSKTAAGGEDVGGGGDAIVERDERHLELAVLRPEGDRQQRVRVVAEVEERPLVLAELVLFSLRESLHEIEFFLHVNKDL